MIIKSAEFITSVSDKNQILKDGIPEVAIIGRSNVGKSSFINFMTNNKNLAKTSKAPGRTRLINYFSINKESFRFVDLPGYGYAKVSATEKAKWGALIEGYLAESEAIKNVFLLLDIRHDPTADDIIMLNYLYNTQMPFTVILTKADKLSKLQCNKRKSEIAAKTTLGIDNLIVTSSLDKKGDEAVLKRLESLLS